MRSWADAGFRGLSDVCRTAHQFLLHSSGAPCVGACVFNVGFVGG